MGRPSPVQWRDRGRGDPLWLALSPLFRDRLPVLWRPMEPCKHTHEAHALRKRLSVPTVKPEGGPPRKTSSYLAQIGKLLHT